MADKRGTGARAQRPKGEQTRARIIQAANEIFAASGYSATRLEDIAAAVGVKRAALVYYFRDKQELYQAAASESTAGLVERVREIFSRDAPPQERLEAMVNAWVDTVAERPWLARLMLREFADATPESEPRYAANGREMLGLTESVLEEGRRAGVFEPVDAMHLASAIAGATIFFVSVIPTIAPRGSFDPLSPKSLRRHREELLSITRRLLGTDRETGAPPRVTAKAG